MLAFVYIHQKSMFQLNEQQLDFRINYSTKNRISTAAAYNKRDDLTIIVCMLALKIDF